MKNSIKLKGRLKKYLQTSIYLGILLILVTLGIFVIDYRAGLILACFDIFYYAVVLSLFLYNKPIIMNELISFATQYGQIHGIARYGEVPAPNCYYKRNPQYQNGNWSMKRNTAKFLIFHLR